MLKVESEYVSAYKYSAVIADYLHAMTENLIYHNGQNLEEWDTKKNKWTLKLVVRTAYEICERYLKSSFTKCVPRMEHGHWVCDTSVPEFLKAISNISPLEKPLRSKIPSSILMDRMDSIGRHKVLFRDGMVYDFKTEKARKGLPTDRMRFSLKIPFKPLPPHRLQALRDFWTLVEAFFVAGNAVFDDTRGL